MPRKGSSMRALVGCRVLSPVTERILHLEYCSVIVKDISSNLCVESMLN